MAEIQVYPLYHNTVLKKYIHGTYDDLAKGLGSYKWAIIQE